MAARTPPKLVSKDYIEAYQQVKGNYEEKFRLFDQLREEENWYREVFAQQRDSDVLNDPHLCLVPAHDVPSDFFKVVEQSKQEKNLPRIFGEEWAEKRRQSKASDAILNEDDAVEGDEETADTSEIPAAVRTDTASSIVSESEFHKQFDIFTEGQFRYFNWDNVFAAGGSILAALMPVPEEHAAKNSTRRNFFHKLMYSNSDIDLFIYGLNEEDANKKLVEMYESIKDNLPVEAICFRSKYAVTIVSRYPFRHIQIVLRLYKSPAEILMGFDVDVCSVGFDGKKVWMTPRAHRALTHRYNTVDMERRSPSYETRLTKYAERGFSVVVPSLDRTRIDPQIYERRFDQLQGLPRLLLMEAMPDVDDRISYKNKMKQLKLLPAIDASRPTVWNRLTGQEEDIDTEEEEEEEEEDFDDQYYYARKKAYQSDYSSVFLPWGEGYTAESIRKLMYTKDMVLNSEWYDPSKKYHTHPTFFGTATEVLRDCCGHCPPVPPGVNMAEEPYVQGVLTWVTVNPGAQGKIGSFHPITEGDWTEGTYIIDLNIQLLRAVNLNDVNRVRELLDQNVDVDGRDPYGRTPLMIACMGGCLESAQVLIRGGARISSHTPDGKTGLLLAVENGCANMVELLLKRKDEIDREWKEKHPEENVEEEPFKSTKPGKKEKSLPERKQKSPKMKGFRYEDEEEEEEIEEKEEEDDEEAEVEEEEEAEVEEEEEAEVEEEDDEEAEQVEEEEGGEDASETSSQDEDFHKIRKNIIHKAGTVISEEFKDDLNLNAGSWDYPNVGSQDDDNRLTPCRSETSQNWLLCSTRKTFSLLLESLDVKAVRHVEEFQWTRLRTVEQLRDIERWYVKRGMKGRMSLFPPEKDNERFKDTGCQLRDPIHQCLEEESKLKDEHIQLIDAILKDVYNDKSPWKKDPNRIKQCLRVDLQTAIREGNLKVVELFLGYDLLVDRSAKSAGDSAGPQKMICNSKKPKAYAKSPKKKYMKTGKRPVKSRHRRRYDFDGEDEDEDDDDEEEEEEDENGRSEELTGHGDDSVALDGGDPQMIGTFLRVVQLQSLSKEMVEEVQKKQLPFNNFDLLNQKIRVGDFVDKKGRAKSSDAKRVEGPKARGILSRGIDWNVSHRSVETWKAVLEAFPDDPKWVPSVIHASDIFAHIVENKDIDISLYTLFLDAKRNAPKTVKQQLYEGLDISGKKSDWAGEHHMRDRSISVNQSRCDIVRLLHDYSKKYPGCFEGNVARNCPASSMILPLLSDDEVKRLNDNGDTALHTAVHYAPENLEEEDDKPWEEVVKQFVNDPRLDLQHRNEQGYTAIELAVREDKHWIVRFLLEKTSDEQLKRDKQKRHQSNNNMPRVEPVDLTGKVAIVTGANTGIGYITAREMAKMGAHIIVSHALTDSRSLPAVEKLKEESGSQRVEFLPLDLASLASVRDFVDAFHKRNLPLHVLINNAGVVALPKRQTTKDGFEMQMGVNHLVERNVSGDAHGMSKLDLYDIHSEKRGSYAPWRTYGNSKLANIPFTMELQKRFDQERVDVAAWSLHPGIVRTELTRNLDGFLAGFFRTVGPLFQKTPEQGALTSLFCAVRPEALKSKGKYLSDLKVARTQKTCDELAIKLWKLSEEVTDGASFACDTANLLILTFSLGSQGLRRCHMQQQGTAYDLQMQSVGAGGRGLKRSTRFQFNPDTSLRERLQIVYDHIRRGDLLST
ncbi:hypothetical protein PROFUN_06948 [Planoprotostelium fungivorum]|uniref:Uncharacterized protein n=1 Tax=Planoprotostelium fungivorum TaxID=1890364 RepID=A0A2P6NN95_9EUKA|nr:hypothetical protein PROFUN_06948 [Planoprotostelium fungivorum]